MPVANCKLQFSPEDSSFSLQIPLSYFKISLIYFSYLLVRSNCNQFKIAISNCRISSSPFLIQNCRYSNSLFRTGCYQLEMTSKKILLVLLTICLGWNQAFGEMLFVSWPIAKTLSFWARRNRSHLNSFRWQYRSDSTDNVVHQFHSSEQGMGIPVPEEGIWVIDLFDI